MPTVSIYDELIPLGPANGAAPARPPRIPPSWIWRSTVVGDAWVPPDFISGPPTQRLPNVPIIAPPQSWWAWWWRQVGTGFVQSVLIAQPNHHPAPKGAMRAERVKSQIALCWSLVQGLDGQSNTWLDVICQWADKVDDKLAGNLTQFCRNSFTTLKNQLEQLYYDYRAVGTEFQNTYNAIQGLSNAQIIPDLDEWERVLGWMHRLYKKLAQHMKDVRANYDQLMRGSCAIVESGFNMQLDQPAMTAYAQAHLQNADSAADIVAYSVQELQAIFPDLPPIPV